MWFLYVQMRKHWTFMVMTEAVVLKKGESADLQCWVLLWLSPQSAYRVAIQAPYTA